MSNRAEKYYLKDNGVFPNSLLPVIHYRGILHFPLLFAARYVRKLFSRNGWTNNWKSGIYTYHHYHSVTHEALGVYRGETTLQLGGEGGPKIEVRKGDVLVIPAGVAHKNLGEENAVICVGGYPGGTDFDMNYGVAGERPQTDINIASTPVPKTDPVLGKYKGVCQLWQ